MQPYKKMGQKITTDASGVAASRSFVAHVVVSAADAVAADPDAVHVAIADTGALQVLNQGIVNPSVPRNITATAGGTATDIGAIQVTIEGTNYADEVITETLPAFTVDTAGTVVGTKAFKTVTLITIPAHGGLGATTSIGFGDVLGLPYLLEHNTILKTFHNDVLEGTAPTVNVDPVNIENNTIELNTALDGSKVDIYMLV
jgi:hypothetical protein